MYSATTITIRFIILNQFLENELGKDAKKLPKKENEM